MKLNIDLPLHTMTSKELEILRYVLENSSDVESMSIQQLAENISYSTSTILRFCRKLGFKGYPELKFFLRNQIKLSSSTPSYQLSADSLSKIKTNIMTDLEGTGGLLNSDSLPQVSALLNRNSTVYLHKPGGITDITIDYLESILFIAGFRNVYKSTSRRTTSHLIKVAPKDAIFIFISTSGSFSQTLDLAKEARLAGMQVISISSVESNELAEISALNLRFFTKVRENSGADLTSRLCTFFVLSTLIEYIASGNRKIETKTDLNSEDINAVLPNRNVKLSDTELMIQDYFNDKINSLSQFSLNDISNSLYVSPSTIVRFCQKAGFKGFNEFKYYLRNRNSFDYRTNSPWKVIQHNISILKDVMDSVDDETILKVCELIKNSSSFYIYGRNMSSIPARYLHSMMTTMDIPSILIDWIDFLSGLSNSFNEETLLIMFTNYGDKEVYSKIMEHCHSRKVKIVWISSNEVDNSLLSDEDIYIYTNEGKLQDVNLRTKISSITIIQLIIELLIQHKFN